MLRQFANHQLRRALSPPPHCGDFHFRGRQSHVVIAAPVQPLWEYHWYRKSHR